MKGKELWANFSKGLIIENPILVLALSLCPALAVTTSVETSLAMGLCVTFVMTLNNWVVSLVRNFVNPKVRAPIYITSIATIVTVVELLLRAFSPVLYKALGIYLSLIVVFAIILARAEVFASKNTPLPSFVDGFGMGCGFTLAMVLIGGIREVFGNGTILGYTVLPSSYQPALIFILAPGAFILIGYLVAAFKMLTEYLEQRGEAA
ncbi:MAG TPA: electron transport complex subunit E [Syntrophaceticus sp.]|jgi:electron transport complex protein RnfE|uniref:Electron transport complex protein RnfE n=1 Tax=Syntrophaceticus schinkii TaxID=499207 RepID=A0A0B7MMT8_9FIRM|nr:electron transport complex subunit E [Syntrophaceticus schinkii]MDD2361198.1 electron transport complex subunit E [Syntrophaceticus schinkii]MDD4675479.1 electron transport complex subunit E [Syntrophaceticus schinkii]CEO89256.1 Electron transport complex protein RnfE [Syntrophaceticus schinkii]HHY30238.1 electron transport complex subunit E [Syntrophaceticus sp.]